VVESFLKSKKYIVPSAIASPVFAGCVFAVYVGTGAGRFEPDRDALVFNPGSDPQSPIARADRKAYQKQLKNLLAEADPITSGQSVDKAWERLQAKARPDFDETGPVLQMQVGERSVRVGASAENVLNGDGPPLLAQQILEARLQSELRHAPPHGISQREVAREWNLLKQSMLQQGRAESDSVLSARSAPDHEHAVGNGP
jgi:hypothetical protein